jgi:hypothetical protein
MAAASYGLTDADKATHAGADPAANAAKAAVLNQETHNGYLFWGLTTAAILVTEVLGANFISWATKQLHDLWHVIPQGHLTIPWPTISWTTGHLENDWSGTAAIVVALIAVGVFYALSKQPSDTSQGRHLRDPGTTRTPWRFYGWWVSVFPPIAAGFIGYYTLNVGEQGLDADESAHRKFLLGCVIYGTFATLGVILPSVLIFVFRREVQFPALMFTIRRLRLWAPWSAALIVGGMAILFVHLALYPWPDITKEPTKYAGDTADDARALAVAAVRKDRDPALPKLVSSAQIRGIDGGDEAWVVFFKPKTTTTGARPGDCYVIVKGPQATTSGDPCKK